MVTRDGRLFARELPEELETLCDVLIVRGNIAKNEKHIVGRGVPFQKPRHGPDTFVTPWINPEVKIARDENSHVLLLVVRVESD